MTRRPALYGCTPHAALAVTAALPGRADAQIIINPTVSGSPYLQTSNYWSPGYNYNFAWTNPYYNTYQSYWGGPYGNYNWTWVTPNYYPTYTYGALPYGWRGRYWR